MSDPARFPSGRQWTVARLRRACVQGVCAAACLLAIQPAAWAHGDDTPTSDLIAWGVVCFVVTLAFTVIACLRAPIQARPRYRPKYVARLRHRPGAQQRRRGWRRRR